ncbi:hypothetical protein EDD11_010005 [Mortierella claussenii]|nr:hypothetical protein EDD11_010005 [Mortierella claussenii]
MSSTALKKRSSALLALDALLASAAATASERSSSPRTPTRLMQPRPPNRGDTRAYSYLASPFVPVRHPDDEPLYENHITLDYANDDDEDDEETHESSGQEDEDEEEEVENHDEEDEENSLYPYTSSKDFSALLHSHMQQQQMLHRQRLQQQHLRQQQLRQRLHEEHQKKSVERREGQDPERLKDRHQRVEIQNSRHQADSERQVDSKRAADSLPNPFLELPTEPAASSAPTRPRGPYKTKNKNSNHNSAAATTTTLSSTSTSTSTSESSTSSGTAVGTPNAITSTPTTTDGPTTTTGAAPKRQYKKTILRQQAALLAAQIKDENESRDLEATRRVLTRADVIKHLRSLRSRLTYAHYKVDRGLEEQPLHMVSELFEDSLDESGDSDGKRLSRLHNSTPTRTSSVKISTLNSTKAQSRVGQSPPVITTCTTIHSSPSVRSTSHNKDPLGDRQEEENDESDGQERLPIRSQTPPSPCKTPVKKRSDHQVRLAWEDAESDHGGSTVDDDDSETETAPLTPTRPFKSRLSSTRASLDNAHFSMAVVTQEELQRQQRLQLEELQRKQLEQLQELQRMQREQQLALQKAHAQVATSQRPTPTIQAAAPSTSKSRGSDARLAMTVSSPEKQVATYSPSVIRLEKQRQQAALSSAASQHRHTTDRGGKSLAKPDAPRASSVHSRTSWSSSPFLVETSDILAGASNTQMTSHQRQLHRYRRSLKQQQRSGGEEEIEQSRDRSEEQPLKEQQQRQRREQEEHRQRQQQKLEANRQKEQELLHRQRQLEQQQQQQHRRKQLLLHLQQHQLQEQDKKRSQEASSSPLLAKHDRSPLTALLRTPVSSSPSQASSVATPIFSTPKKKKPLNPVQKAPSTENILASVRSTPPNVRSALTAVSPAFAVAKNVLLGNKRAMHAAFEDKENHPNSPSSSPLRGKSFTGHESAHSTLDRSPLSKRQRPGSVAAAKNIVEPWSSAMAPSRSGIPAAHGTPLGTFSGMKNPNLKASVRSSPTPRANSGSTLDPSPSVSLTSKLMAIQTMPSDFAAATVPMSVSLPETSDLSTNAQTNKEFLNCFEEWMSDLGGEDVQGFSMPDLSQPLFDLGTSTAVAATGAAAEAEEGAGVEAATITAASSFLAAASQNANGPDELEESQAVGQSGTEDDYGQEQSDEGDETELDESEIDQLLYSEVGDDYGDMYGTGMGSRDLGYVSTPGSDFGGGVHDLASDPVAGDLYDWFPTNTMSTAATQDLNLSLLSSDPILSSSPAELAQGLDLDLGFDPAGDPLWIQQELCLQQQMQLQQLQQAAQGPLASEDGGGGYSSRPGTPPLDSTASTLLSSSSFSDILLPQQNNHHHHYLPMGPDGQVATYSPAADDRAVDELPLQKYDPNLGNVNCIFNV